MPSCSRCQITWTVDTVLDCPRCRYRPTGGSSFNQLVKTVLLLFVFQAFLWMGASVLIGGQIAGVASWSGLLR
jgi:hypothetical protein